MDLEEVYNAIIGGTELAVLITPHAGIVTLPDLEKTYDCLNLLPGRFRTLSQRQLEIFAAMSDRPQLMLRRFSAFELSLTQEKCLFSLEDFTEAYSHFEGKLPLLVTNAETFIEKCGLFRKFYCCHFYIGYNTASAVITAYGVLGVEALHAKFTVFARERRFLAWATNQVPHNYQVLTMENIRRK